MCLNPDLERESFSFEICLLMNNEKSHVKLYF